mgnify:CR=1 FL=1
MLDDINESWHIILIYIVFVIIISIIGGFFNSKRHQKTHLKIRENISSEEHEIIPNIKAKTSYKRGFEACDIIITKKGILLLGWINFFNNKWFVSPVLITKDAKKYNLIAVGHTLSNYTIDYEIDENRLKIIAYEEFSSKLFDKKRKLEIKLYNIPYNKIQKIYGTLESV